MQARRLSNCQRVPDHEETTRRDKEDARGRGLRIRGRFKNTLCIQSERQRETTETTQGGRGPRCSFFLKALRGRPLGSESRVFREFRGFSRVSGLFSEPYGGSRFEPKTLSLLCCHRRKKREASRFMRVELVQFSKVPCASRFLRRTEPPPSSICPWAFLRTSLLVSRRNVKSAACAALALPGAYSDAEIFRRERHCTFPC